MSESRCPICKFYELESLPYCHECGKELRRSLVRYFGGVVTGRWVDTSDGLRRWTLGLSTWAPLGEMFQEVPSD